MKRVVSVWLPRLPVERLRRVGVAPPDEVPFALVAAGPRRELSAVGAAAARAGLRPGLVVADAQAMLPGLMRAPADPVADAAERDRLAGWCDSFTPWAAPDPTPPGGGLWLDVSGCAALFDGEAALRTALVAGLAAEGYTARAALADTPGAAWAWARFGDPAAPCLPPGGQRAALAPLPLAALRLDPDLVAALARLGLRRIGDLAPLPRAGLAARFGPDPIRRLDQALGHLPEPLSPRRAAPERRVGARFAEPLGRPEDLAEAVRRLVERLCRRLEADGLGLRHLTVTAWRVDGTRPAVAVGTGRPSRAPAPLLRLLAEVLPRLDPGFGIEALILTPDGLAPLDPAQSALDRPPEDSGSDALGRLVDALGNRFGFDRIARPAPRPSHLPERAVEAVPPAAAVAGGWPPSRRPVRLLSRPEPVEVVGSPPAAFRWRRRTHRLARAEGVERIADEWWRRPAPARDYYLVEDEAGARFWLFQAGGHGWYLHGLFP
jgi:protein ImuB